MHSEINLWPLLLEERCAAACSSYATTSRCVGRDRLGVFAMSRSPKVACPSLEQSLRSNRAWGLECRSTAASMRCSSSAVIRRLRPEPGAGLRMFITGFDGRPTPHSLIATVKRWPRSARSSRTVLFARGCGLPSAFLRSSPAKRASRNLATISGVRAAN
jgi:hypothetical protein